MFLLYNRQVIMLKLFNFLTRKKENFKPLKKGSVGLYTCGPTVYNYVHIGNLRTYVFEDVLRRTLGHAGYKVKHVMNITDVDDKTVRDSQRAGKTLQEFTRFYTKEFLQDLSKLNILPAWKYPSATKHIPEMVSLIKTLLRKKIAYVAEDGVYFDISRLKSYGKLSQIKKRQLKSGARVNADEYSKDEARDFVLWKFKKPGEPFWPAPFGAGRPGWHIECSAMSMKYLGKTFDIHSAGIDLLFPHHENEIAQSEGATGKKFVKYFVEGEHLLVERQKMAKSLRNVVTIKDLEKRGFNPLAFRYLVLSAHYRSRLEGAKNALERLYEFVSSLKELIEKPKAQMQADMRVLAKFAAEAKKAFFDDLDTPKALSIVWNLVRAYNKNPEKYDKKTVLGMLYDFDKVLGLGFENLKVSRPPAEVLKLLEEREEARKDRNFALADEIREKIKQLGWQINDTPSGAQLFHS